MRWSFLTRTPCGLAAWVLMPALLVISSCQTMDPAVNVGAALGVSAGVISQQHADSIVRSAKAVGKTFQEITPEQEYYIGRSVAATVLQTYRAYPDSEANQYLNWVGQSLALASDRPETFGGYHFLIVDSDEINAFAAPGGLILVSRGMLRLCKDEDQVASVLAHEIGHVKGQDGLRAIKTSRMTSALSILAAEGMKNLGSSQMAQLTEVFEGSVTDIASTLMNKGYSRELERQADQEALTILNRVGYDPGALTGMLKEMDKRLVRTGPGFAKTHPDPKERILDVEAQTKGYPKTAVSPERAKRFDRFMARI